MVAVEQVARSGALLRGGLEGCAIARQAKEERDVGIFRARVDLGGGCEPGAKRGSRLARETTRDGFRNLTGQRCRAGCDEHTHGEGARGQDHDRSTQHELDPNPGDASADDECLIQRLAVQVGHLASRGRIADREEDVGALRRGTLEDFGEEAHRIGRVRECRQPHRVQ